MKLILMFLYFYLRYEPTFFESIMTEIDTYDGIELYNILGFIITDKYCEVEFRENLNKYVNYLENNQYQ